MELNPAVRLSAANSALASAVLCKEDENGMRRAKLRQLRTAFTPARIIDMRKRFAALTASSAVTGPCTAGYGPCIAGKKKIANTLTTAITASMPAIRPELMNVIIMWTCVFSAA
jgi:hypothetical protein